MKKNKELVYTELMRITQLERKYPEIEWLTMYHIYGMEEVERRVELFEENFYGFLAEK